MPAASASRIASEPMRAPTSVESALPSRLPRPRKYVKRPSATAASTAIATARARFASGARRSSVEASTAPVSATRRRPTREPRGPFAGGDRDANGHDRAAGDDRRDDAHRPERERLVERGQADPAADAGEHAEPERAPFDLAAGDRERDEQRREARGLRDHRHRDRRQPPREQPAAEVGEAPRRRRGEREQDGDRAHALKLIDRARAGAGPAPARARGSDRDALDAVADERDGLGHRRGASARELADLELRRPRVLEVVARDRRSVGAGTWSASRSYARRRRRR